jgi:hypothetical protein
LREIRIIHFAISSATEDNAKHFLNPYCSDPSRSRGNRSSMRCPGTYTLFILAREVGQQDAVGGGSQMVQIVDSDVHVTVPIGKPGEVRGRVALQTTGIAFSDLQVALRSTAAC